MKLMTSFIPLYLFSLCVFVCADLDRELRKSIDAAMKCQYREPPKGPVIAATPSRFAQIVVILHERFKTPSCFKTTESAVSISDETTWPFCVFGRCKKGRCECAGHFSGSKCHIYKKKCWLMYCYLTSCLPSHQSLHCICDPSLYGTKISGFYWYDEGQSSKFIPPPAGWEDEPTGMIKLKSDDIMMGAGGTGQNAAAVASSAHNSRGSQTQSGGSRNQGSGNQGYGNQGNRNQGSGNQETRNQVLSSAFQVNQKTASGQRRIGTKQGFESGAFGSFNRGNGDENEGVTKKDDVEEALEELEEVSSVSMLEAQYDLILIIIYLLLICR